MTQIAATIQAKPDEPETERPSRDRVETLATELEKRGFEVVRAGRFGVSVTADGSVFQRVFGMDPAPAQAFRRKVAADCELSDLAEAVEVIPPPVLLGR